MDDWSPVETLTAVFLGLAVLAGAAYGAFGVGTVAATIGGAALSGVFALVFVSLVALAVTVVARLLGGGRDR